jgi:Predicted metal-binding protein (DUF2284)
MEIARVQPTNSPDRKLILEDLLATLRGLALKEGASECAVIDCGDIKFEEAISGASNVPDEEKSLFWPVPRFPRDSIYDGLTKYSRALVFRVNIEGGTSPSAAREKVFKIAGLLESACFYGGSHLSISLAAGNCKDIFCDKEPGCQALKTGKPCLHPLKSRLSVEASGLDPKMIAEKAGWEKSGEDFFIGMVFVS